MIGEVAVRIDAVANGDQAVLVVVPQVLAPQPLDIEGVLIAVRVGDEDKPQFDAAQQVPDLLVASVVLVNEVVERPEVDLAADPFASVLEGGVEDRGLVRPAPARHPHGEDVATTRRGPDRLQLNQIRVRRREVFQLVLDASVLVP